MMSESLLEGRLKAVRAGLLRDGDAGGRPVARATAHLASPADSPATLSSWTTRTSILDPIHEEAARRLSCRLRDARVRRAVTAVVAKALDERGYEGVAYPYLARLAGVETQDVERVFPSKAELVLAALGRSAWSQAPFGLPGGEIVARYLTFWEQDDNTSILRELLCAAISDRRLAMALERHVIGTVIRPFAEEEQSTDAYPRARLAFAALLGLAVSRYVLRQEPLASADHETLAAWMGPALDHFLHGKLGEAVTSAGSVGRAARRQPGSEMGLHRTRATTRKRPAIRTEPTTSTEPGEPDPAPWSGQAWTEPLAFVRPV